VSRLYFLSPHYGEYKLNKLHLKPYTCNGIFLFWLR